MQQEARLGGRCPPAMPPTPPVKQHPSRKACAVRRGPVFKGKTEVGHTPQAATETKLTEAEPTTPVLTETESTELGLAKAVTDTELTEVGLMTVIMDTELTEVGAH